MRALEASCSCICSLPFANVKRLRRHGASRERQSALVLCCGVFTIVTVLALAALAALDTQLEAVAIAASAVRPLASTAAALLTPLALLDRREGLALLQRALGALVVLHRRFDVEALEAETLCGVATTALREALAIVLETAALLAVAAIGH